MRFLVVALLGVLLGLGSSVGQVFAQACGANTPRYCVDSSGNIWANGLQARTGATGAFTFPFTTTAVTLTNNTNQIMMGTTNVGTQTTAALSANRTWTWPNVSGNVITSGDTGTVTNTMLAGSIAASKLVGTDIATVGTITSGTWSATAIAASKLVGTDIATVGTITSGTWSATAIAASKGGTGIDTSAATGVPSIAAGVWSTAAALANTLGGTGQNSSAWSAIPTVTAGVWAQYAGTSCTNQFVRSLSALAAATCASVGNADIAAGAIHTTQLSTSTGVVSSAPGAAIDFTLNDYSFFPSLTNTASNPTLVAKNAADPGDTVGRITALAGAGGSGTTARWRYINASFQPTLWVAIDGAGAIQGGWESEDPPSASGSPVQTGGFTSVQVQLPSDLDSLSGVAYTYDGISYTPDTYLTNRVYPTHPEVQSDSARQTRIRRFVIMRGSAQAANQLTLTWIANRYKVVAGVLTLK